MSNFSIDLDRAQRPNNTVDTTTGEPARWGTVYQNYISVNLNSEDLAKGAYDAYNLLTSKKLFNVVKDTFDYIQAVENNVETLADSVAERVTKESNRIDNITGGLNNLFGPGSSADAAAIIKAKYPLTFPHTDSGDTTSYDLSSQSDIPLAGLQNGVPGFIKGQRALQLGSLMRKVFSPLPLSGYYSETLPNTILPDWSQAPSAEIQPMRLLVFQVNQLQMQVEYLRTVINDFFSGRGSPRYTVDTLYVKSIRFVAEEQPNGSVSTGAHIPASMYLDYDQFTMPNSFTNGDL